MSTQNSLILLKKAVSILGVVGASAFLGLPAVANFYQKTSIQPVVKQPLQVADNHSADADQDIVATAKATDGFKTLAAALEAAGLVETLQGEGLFTVFAPIDAAFAALPEGTLEDLLKPENKDKLVDILTYHVVPGKVESGALQPGDVKTVQGSAVNVEFSGTDVKVGGAKVVTADVAASNGVIHVIDAVILPPTE